MLSPLYTDPVVLDVISDALGDFLGDLLFWVFSGLVAILSGTGMAVYQNRRRIERLEKETEINGDPTRLGAAEERMSETEEKLDDIKRYFEGDENDPNNPGLMYKIDEIEKAVKEAKRKSE